MPQVRGNEEFREKGLMSSAVVEQKKPFLGPAMVLLDLQGLMFVAEKVTNRLITQRKEKGNV